MRNRYQVQILTMVGRYRDKCVARRRFKTLASAEAWASKVLDRHPTEVTRYRRDTDWTARFADLGKDRSGKILARPYLDGPEILVPTVGELGYW